LRISEAAQITVVDLFFSNGRLRKEARVRGAISKGNRQRCIYLTSARLVAAIDRYAAYGLANSTGITMDSSYRGLQPRQPFVITRRGSRFSMNLKRRISESGELVDYWAAQFREQDFGEIRRYGRCCYATRA